MAIYVLVQKTFTNPVDSTVSLGLEEKLPVEEVVSGAPATLTVAGAVKQGAFVAAAAVPFADLTAAANSFNALRTSLINAGVIAAS